MKMPIPGRKAVTATGLLNLQVLDEGRYWVRDDKVIADTLMDTFVISVQSDFSSKDDFGSLSTLSISLTSSPRVGRRVPRLYPLIYAMMDGVEGISHKREQKQV